LAVADGGHVVEVDPYERLLAVNTAFAGKEGPDVLSVVNTVAGQVRSREPEHGRKDVVGDGGFVLDRAGGDEFRPAGDEWHADAAFVGIADAAAQAAGIAVLPH